MTTYTKEQIESGSLTPMELVSSWSSGQGNPHKPEYATNKKDVEDFISSNVITENVLAARGILYLIKTGINASMKEALSAGYAGGANHLDQYKEKGGKTKKEEDNAIPGHFMSWEAFLRNSYKEFISYDVLLDAFLCISDKMPKADIIALKEATLVLPQARLEAIEELKGKHVALDIAKFDLAPYLDDIEFIDEKTVMGTINPLLTDKDMDNFDRLLKESFKGYKNEAITSGKFSTKLQVKVFLKD